MKRQLLTLLVLVTVITTSTQGALVFGGFDNNRGGDSDINSASWSDLRSNLSTNFAGTFSSSATLTSGYLNTIDILLVGVALNGTTPVSPLSADEQSAVLNFVLSGGGAIFFLDNDIQFEAVSDSIGAPFGLDTTGNIPGSTASTITNPNHPVANGPFGMVSSFTHASFPGWFANLGANAASVATLDSNGQVSLAAISRGQLGVGSGGVVFFSDSVQFNGNFAGDVATLVDNAIAFAVPEPSGAMLFLSILSIILLRRSRTGKDSMA